MNRLLRRVHGAEAFVLAARSDPHPVLDRSLSHPLHAAAFGLLIFLLLAPFGARAAPLRPKGSDPSQVVARYERSVRALLGQEDWEAEAVRGAVEAAGALADSGAPEALVWLAEDGARVAEKLSEVERRRGEIEAEVEQAREKAAEEPQEAQAVRRLEQEAARLTERAERIASLRDALLAAALEVLEGDPAGDPGDLLARLRLAWPEDVARLARIERTAAITELALKTAKERLDGRPSDDERRELERRVRGLERALAALQAKRSDLDVLHRRRQRLVQRLFDRLPEKERRALGRRWLAEWRKETDARRRAVDAEFLGRLPVDGVVAAFVAEIRRAASRARDLEESLEPLREKYATALRALMSSIRGGNGIVPAPVAQNVHDRERELRAASAALGDVERLLAGCARGLSAAVARDLEEGSRAAIEGVLPLVRREKDPTAREWFVRSLTGCRDADAAELLRDLARRERSVRLRLAALDVLATFEDEATVDLCADELLRDEDWRVRAAAIRYLRDVPRKRAVPALIASLGNEVGRLVDDAASALAALTGQTFGAEVRLWRAWWREHGDSFEIGATAPAAGREPARRFEDAPGHVSFYGIRTRSRRIVFVVDRSGSMGEKLRGGETGEAGRTKLEVAKAELLGAIAALEDDALFNVVTYSEDVTAWRRRMAKASAKSKQAVRRFVRKEIVAGGGTNIHDALLEAFRLAGIGAIDRAYESNVDTIFFLTDGRPTVGEIQDPEKILERVREWNRLARVVIHTVGVGKDHDAVFLRRLAEENGGSYVGRR